MKKFFLLVLWMMIFFGSFATGLVQAADDKYCANAKSTFAPYECFLMNNKYCVNVSSNKDMTKEDCDKKLLELNKPPTVPAPVAPKPAPGKADGSKTVVELVNPIGSTADNIQGTTDLKQIVGKLIASALGILGSLALLVFVYGGFRWVTAAGNAEHVKEGSEAMVWAVVGICIIFSSYAILKLIFSGIGATVEVETNKWGCYCKVNGINYQQVPDLTEETQCNTATISNDGTGTQVPSVDKQGNTIESCSWKNTSGGN